MRVIYWLILIVALMNILLSTAAYGASIGQGNACTAKCNKVLASSYAKLFGIPLGLVGAVSFTILALFLWYLLVMESVWGERLLALMLVSGSLWALHLLYIQAFILHAFCRYCLTIDLSMVIVSIIFIICSCGGKGLYPIIQPLLFKMDPENVHRYFIWLGRLLGSNPITRKLAALVWSYKHPMLHTTIAGVDFPNPVGLAAGFDKYAEMYKILPAVGFGFMELGSFTGHPCAGNPKPRVFRLPEEKSLLVNYGLNNDGAEAVRDKLSNVHFKIPAGMSVAKTNDPNMTEEEALEDYAKGFTLLHPLGSYTTINVSCPSSLDGNTNTFSNPKYLPRLLKKLDQCKHLDKPVFLKIKPDHGPKDIDQILEIARPYKWVTGFILSNLLKNREGLKCKAKVDALCKSGGLSGALDREKSNEQLAYAYKKGKDRFVFIGCGGIFSAEDAYKKIKLGASLVQLITGMIYQGPGLISDINKGLVKLMKRDGFNNISEAVGKDNK